MNYQGIQGFDISTWQDAPTIPGHVDFGRMKAWGANFVIIRAGQGNWKDPDFDTSWANAKGVLPRSSYWFYDNRYPPKDQARKYYETIKSDLEGVCWLDLEDRQTGIYAGWRDWYDFLEEFKYLYPAAQIGIYTGFFYFVDYITYATNAQRDYFGKYPLWLSNYGATGSDPFKPHYDGVLIPLPWLDYLILQTGTPPIGEDVGVESKDVDYNQFNGGEGVFRQYFKMSGATEAPQEGTNTMQGRIKTLTNIRLSNNKGSADMGDLLAGDIVTWDTEVSGTDGLIWCKLISATRDGLPVLCTDKTPVTGRYCWANNVEEIVTPVETFPPRVGLTFDGSVIKWYVPE